MVEVNLARTRIEDGKTDQLRSWFKELQERESEVIETLQHERVYTETAFILPSDDTAYLYVYMEAEDLEEADEAGDKEEYEIDEEHHEVLRDSLTGDWETLETIGHFTNHSLR
jgi:phosphomannomutase